jgi:hypothetical protein
MGTDKKVLPIPPSVFPNDTICRLPWMARSGISTSPASDVVVMQLMRLSFQGMEYSIPWEMLDER